VFELILINELKWLKRLRLDTGFLNFQCSDTLLITANLKILAIPVDIHGNKTTSSPLRKEEVLVSVHFAIDDRKLERKTNQQAETTN
jgi:hypothetical protein